jgi:hypothetical protein
LIDLEELATVRAHTLGQPVEDWMIAVQTEHFGKACTVLTDGDIELIFEVAESPTVLSCLFEGIAQASDGGEDMAFQKMKDHFESQGISFHAGIRLWEKAWMNQKDFEKCLGSIKKPSVEKKKGKR